MVGMRGERDMVGIRGIIGVAGGHKVCCGRALKPAPQFYIAPSAAKIYLHYMRKGKKITSSALKPE